jgi:hypothetical protein
MQNVQRAGVRAAGDIIRIFDLCHAFSEPRPVDDPNRRSKLEDSRYGGNERRVMERPNVSRWRPGRSALRGLAWFVAGLATISAILVGAVLAVVFAATFVVIGVMTSAVVGLSLAAFKARRTVRAAADVDIMEARNVGGHSWVAYGWDGARH